jgi:aminopeptidase N
MLRSAARLPSAVSRAVVVTTAWDMLVWSELTAADLVGCVTAVVAEETVDSLVEPYWRSRWRPQSFGRPTPRVWVFSGR